MDKYLRELKRDPDPLARLRYARALIQSGAVEDCIKTLCSAADYYKHMGDDEGRQRLLSEILPCLGPTKVYIVIRLNDEGESDSRAVFVNRNEALRNASLMILSEVEDQEDQDLLSDLQLLFYEEDFEEVIAQARYGYLNYYIEECDLRN